MVSKDVLFKTTHGSRLYGLSHDTSDFDYYEVVRDGSTKKKRFDIHLIVGDIDTSTLDWSTWEADLKAGQPKALEAMFATGNNVLVDRIPDYRAAFVAGNDYSQYLGIMKKLRFEYPDSVKHKQHILRLALNMKSLRERGKFNPTLGRVEKELVKSLAQLPVEHVYNDALALAWS